MICRLSPVHGLIFVWFLFFCFILFLFVCFVNTLYRSMAPFLGIICGCPEALAAELSTGCSKAEPRITHPSTERVLAKPRTQEITANENHGHRFAGMFPKCL